MSVSADRRFSKKEVAEILDNVIGKSLGEVDACASNQFLRTKDNPKITGIAGDVIEQSVFGYASDSRQECDIEIDGTLVELKTTGVRVPKKLFNLKEGKTWQEYNIYYKAKEGISITAVTLEPTIQIDFYSSHFWEKAERLLLVFYEYESYSRVLAHEYAQFPIVGYCYNTFSDEEVSKLKRDWEIVRDYLAPFYKRYQEPTERRIKLEGFTKRLRPDLLLLELVPQYKRKSNGSYQRPRYRLKKTFVDYIVSGHFNRTRIEQEVKLKDSFSSFADLDARCHEISNKFSGKSLSELKTLLNISSDIRTKDFTAKCILKMFDAECVRFNQISDFNKVGIIAKTITLNSKERNTEDMKLQHIDFKEWGDRDVDFDESEVYTFFMEHTLLLPVFKEFDSKDKSKTIFLGFKRFAFDDEFINNEVRRMWEDSRRLIHTNTLKWEYKYRRGEVIKNASGSYSGAPNFPKRENYSVFFRGGANNSSDESRTENVNGIKMLPQYYWLKGEYVSEKLKSLNYL